MIGVRRRSATGTGKHLRPIGREDEAAQPDIVAVVHRVSGDRRATRPIQFEQHRPFGIGAALRRRIDQRGNEGLEVAPIFAPFDGDNPLRDRREKILGVERRGDDVVAAQPVQPGPRQHRRVGHPVPQLADSGFDVAAKIDHPKVGSAMQRLRPAS